MTTDTALSLKDIIEARFFLSTDGTENPCKFLTFDRDGERGLLAFRSEEDARTFLKEYGRKYPVQAVIVFPHVLPWFRALRAVQPYVDVLTVFRSLTPGKLSLTHIDIDPLLRDVGNILRSIPAPDGQHRFRGLA